MVECRTATTIATGTNPRDTPLVLMSGPRAPSPPGGARPFSFGTSEKSFQHFRDAVR